jgi:hypothetical protein
VSDAKGLIITVFTYREATNLQKWLNKMKKAFLTVALIGLLSGCAAPSSKPPSASAPREYIDGNSITIRKGFDEVWQGLIEHLSANYFAIDKFEKDSGLIILSFGAGSARKFVDCGEVILPKINYSGPTLNWLESMRPVLLDGKMNIFVKRSSNLVSQVNINTRYIVNYREPLASYMWSFDTAGSDVQKIGDIFITCKPTYEAEKSIISAMEKLSS